MREFHITGKSIPVEKMQIDSEQNTLASRSPHSIEQLLQIIGSISPHRSATGAETEITSILILFIAGNLCGLRCRNSELAGTLLQLHDLAHT